LVAVWFARCTPVTARYTRSRTPGFTTGYHTLGYIHVPVTRLGCCTLTHVTVYTVWFGYLVGSFCYVWLVGLRLVRWLRLHVCSVHTFTLHLPVGSVVTVCYGLLYGYVRLVVGYLVHTDCVCLHTLHLVYGSHLVRLGLHTVAVYVTFWLRLYVYTFTTFTFTFAYHVVVWLRYVCYGLRLRLRLFTLRFTFVTFGFCCALVAHAHTHAHLHAPHAHAVLRSNNGDGTRIGPPVFIQPPPTTCSPSPTSRNGRRYDMTC